jgi:hypothetical protein
MLALLFIGTFCMSSWAGTNIVKRALFTAPDFTITYFPLDAGVVIEVPNYKSKIKQPKRISFNETQKSEIAELLNTYLSFAITLEEGEVKVFSKSIGKIRNPKDDLKWAVEMEAIISVSQEGKALLILEFSEMLELRELTKKPGIRTLVVLDWFEADKVVALIKLIPEMQKEAAAESSK